jgi:hypothetical protein
MVTIKKTKAKVEFAKENIGEVAVTRKRNKIIFSDVLGEYVVGTKPSPEDISKRPKIELEFHNPKSIDVLIAQLLLIRRGFTPAPVVATYTAEQLDQFNKAC